MSYISRNGWFFVALGVIATFCLSVVGAVCDDDNPQCRGNNAVHTYCAMTFFALYNANMVVLTAGDRSPLLRALVADRAGRAVRRRVAAEVLRWVGASRRRSGPAGRGLGASLARWLWPGASVGSVQGRGDGVPGAPGAIFSEAPRDRSPGVRAN